MALRSYFLKFLTTILLDNNQDRLATIIHRGRDHGLPTYTQVRESCGLQPVARFEELNNTVDSHIIAALQDTYQVFTIYVTKHYGIMYPNLNN